MLSTSAKVVSDEGMLGLWKGVNAAWLQEVVSTSLRLGVYEHIRLAFTRDQQSTGLNSFLEKFIAGSAAGAMGMPRW